MGTGEPNLALDAALTVVKDVIGCEYGLSEKV